MAEYVEREEVIKILEGQFTGTYKGTPVYSAEIDRARTLVYDLDAADVVPVVHGRWVKVNTHLWHKNEDGDIDEWYADHGFHNGPGCEICGESFCMHCTPDWKDTVCYVGHYECSECSEASRDGKENYCPNCGARMDGG